MKGPWRTISELLDVARGKIPDRVGPAQRMRLIVAAGLWTLVCAGIWGVAAGSSSLATLAAPNALKVPMVVLFSVLSAMPAGLLAARLSGSTEKTSELALSFCSAVFAGALVAAVLAPIVAVYYATSAWAGPYLGIGSVFVALGVAVLMLFRGAVRGVHASQQSARVVPKIVMAVVTLVVMPQLIALASPILPETTVFDSGVDVVREVG